MGLFVVVLVGALLSAALWWWVFKVLDGEDRRREVDLRAVDARDRAPVPETVSR